MVVLFLDTLVILLSVRLGKCEMLSKLLSNLMSLSPQGGGTNLIVTSDSTSGSTSGGRRQGMVSQLSLGDHTNLQVRV